MAAICGRNKLKKIVYKIVSMIGHNKIKEKIERHMLKLKLNFHYTIKTVLIIFTYNV